MKKSWRSWFWNIFLMVAMLLVSLGVTSVLLSDDNLLVLVGFGIVAAFMWVGAARAPMLGVFARPQGMKVRRFLRTITIPWEEVESVRHGGTAGAVGAGCPIVVRRRPDGKRLELELDVLGSYGIIGPRRSKLSRATEEINEYLENWRKEHT